MRYFLLLILLMHISCHQTSNELRLAAEYDKTESIWLMAPNYDHKEGKSNLEVTLNLIQSILPYAKVNCLVQNDHIAQEIRSKIDPKYHDKLNFVIMPYLEFWARDMGPNFVIQDKKLAMIDYNFNSWGYGLTTDSMIHLDETIDERIAQKMNIPIIQSNLISEGGDHEVNGKGLMILTESVQKMRNPQMKLDEIELEFKRVTGVKKIIWLKQGLAEDDHTRTKVWTLASGQKAFNPMCTNGHSDEYVRFVNDNTLLLASVDPLDMDSISIENRKRLELSYQILKSATDQDSKPLNIIRIPLPRQMHTTMSPKDEIYKLLSKFEYQDGTQFPHYQPINIILAASYLNFTIVNDAVLIPYYYKKGMDIRIKQRDEEAHQIIQKAFPNKKLIPIDVFNLNIGGGGIHCITRNQPKI